MHPPSSFRPHPSSLVEWDPDFLARSPMFEPLRAHAPVAFPAGWPDLAGLQAMLDGREPPVRVASGARLKLVPQAPGRGAIEDKFEPRTFLKGELQVRVGNWHDLLNVLAWLAYPRAKAALNARHFALQEAQRREWRANRGPAQDALTLFDEGGVIVASCDEELLTLLRAFRWKELFWRNRRRVRERMRFYLFGHALHEKALSPFAGITGRCIELGAAPALLDAPLERQLALLDAALADRIATPGRLAGTRELGPLPVLGVPGWCAGNEREDFYDNRDYFRPGRRAGGGTRKAAG